MARFNLSEWALGQKSLVVFLMLVCAIAGVMAYGNLGREEDPPFTIKSMVIKTIWPGATTEDTVEQVTDRIERKLEELPGLDYVKSYTKPGDSVIFVNLKDTVRAEDVATTWYQVRKKIDDIRHTLPSEIRGPMFNDEFGETYSVIYAFTSDGFTHRELRDEVDNERSEILGIADVAKVELLGVQDEKIYLDFSTRQLAAYGLDTQQLSAALQAQNVVTPSGTITTDEERISVRVTGSFDTVESLKAVNFVHNGAVVRLSDIATVSRDYSDPPQPMFRYNGKPAIGLAVSMSAGGDVLALGEAIEHRMEDLQTDLPIGIDVNLVANQPHIVEESVGEFTKSLGEAIAIVLGVSFLALGFRPGIVVAVAIPLVLAITFVVMDYLGVSLQRISLGALIIALGLLVDDAMIAVEMMITKLEEGYSKVRAAAFAYTSTAFPMLTGTLVTIAGFTPIGLAKSGAGEYTFTMFVVITVALVASWIVAVLFTPLTGVFLLPERMAAHGHREPSRFARLFAGFLAAAMRRAWLTIAVTVGLFALSLYGMTFVQQEFFPESDRPELLVNLTLPQGASIEATEATVERLEENLAADPGVEHWSFYVGQGAVRFYLPLDAQLGNDFFAQAVIVTKGLEERKEVQARLEALLAEDFGDILTRVSPLEQGPPVGWPLKFRISGRDPAHVRELAYDFAARIGLDPGVRNINFDWNEQSKVVRVNIDQDRARSLGINTEQLSGAINAVLSGTTVTQLRDGIYLVDVIARAGDDERTRIDAIRDLTVATPSGQRVPLEQVAEITFGMEAPLIWRRERMATITVQADTAPGVEAATVTERLADEITAFRTELPAGYAVAVGGMAEDSAKSQASIIAGVPMMLTLMMIFLMIQLRSFQRLAMALLTAPLALIGVSASFLLSGAPMGFVAILGIISLIGMVIRNSVILIVQIDQNIAEGQAPWQSVIDATTHRVRPILLTAAAAILGMVPIAASVFWGPMAYAVMGGLAVATALTLVFLPALYVAWFRIRPETALAEPAGFPGLRPDAIAAE
jgi:multidrug efflux pump subunit AcrB